MNLSVFTNEFLPQLVHQFTEQSMDLHSLVDFDLWRKFFPTANGTTPMHEINWNEIRFNAFSLQDGTLLLTYELPNPTIAYRPKFIGIRIDRKSRDSRYYVLLRAKYYDEPWEIHSMDYTSANTSGKHPLTFLRMIEGTWSLRNFVLTIQQTPLVQDKTSLFGRLKRDFTTRSLFQDE